MPMYNLIEYSWNYSETKRSLWFYSKDEATDFDADIANNDNFKSFKYKAKLIWNAAADGANRLLKNATITVPLKYLSNFWRSLEIPLINCKVELKLKWTSYCILSAAGADNDNANGNNTIFTSKDTKVYVPVMTLSARNNQKQSKLLSKGFKRSGFFWTNIKQKMRIKIQ